MAGKKSPRRIKNQKAIAKRKRARKAGVPAVAVTLHGSVLTVAAIREMVRQLKSVKSIKPDASGKFYLPVFHQEDIKPITGDN